VTRDEGRRSQRKKVTSYVLRVTSEEKEKKSEVRGKKIKFKIENQKSNILHSLLTEKIADFFLSFPF